MRKRNASPSIREVEKEFKKWRRKRKAREPIPEHLWEAAAGLTRDSSVCEVAKRLHLNYTALKDRVGMDGPSRVPRQHKGPASFVEVPIGMLEGGGQGEKARCVVKLRRADGAEMTVMFHGEKSDEIVAVVRGFLGSVA
jgi:hypothetical protein